MSRTYFGTQGLKTLLDRSVASGVLAFKESSTNFDAVKPLVSDPGVVCLVGRSDADSSALEVMDGLGLKIPPESLAVDFENGDRVIILNVRGRDRDEEGEERIKCTFNMYEISR
jgi:hypothetical protein